jgi:undecaprenyl pyrophosphate phosphatase UppP
MNSIFDTVLAPLEWVVAWLMVGFHTIFTAIGLPTEANGILGQVAAGSLVARVAAYLSLRFLTRHFPTHTLTAFAIYCTLAGLVSLEWLTLT